VNGTSFTFVNKLTSGAAYAVTVANQPTGQSCSVINGSGVAATANITNVAVTCLNNTYTVGGTNSSLASVSISGSSIAGQAASTSNPYQFSARFSDIVTLTATKSGSLCTVTGSPITMGAANVSNANVTCNSVPGAPVALTATGGKGLITMTFSAPTSSGDGALTGYIANCSATGSAAITGSATAAATSINVAGLTNGTTYSCTVTASNAYGSSAASNALSATPNANAFKIEAWADNWFSVYANNAYINEDHIPITQVRSFNSETFTFSATYPFDLNFVIKDYVQLDYLNGDTGLEYINNVGGTQQMGDGGFIMQLTDTDSGKLAAVSSSAFKCLVIHKAPTNKSCASQPNPTTAASSCGVPVKLTEPTNWKDRGFDTTGWGNASVYTGTQIGVKEGYYDITWQPSAKLIWTGDLQADNTLLCKLTVNQPP
jgi:hypothetical protein